MAVFIISLSDTAGGFIQLKVAENQLVDPSAYIEALVRREMKKALHDLSLEETDNAKSYEPGMIERYKASFS